MSKSNPRSWPDVPVTVAISIFLSSAPAPPDPPRLWHATHDCPLKTGPEPITPVASRVVFHPDSLEQFASDAPAISPTGDRPWPDSEVGLVMPASP